MGDFGFSKDELKFLRKLDKPEKIQDYLDSLDYNWCDDGYECKSPRYVLSENNAHCLEGALFAAAAMKINGGQSLILETVADEDDYHFLCPFKENGLWGAMAQSRTYTLKWRDPVFRDIRELVMSYFPFFSYRGELILNSYSDPVDVFILGEPDWMTTDRCLERLGEKMDDIPHHSILPSGISLRCIPLELNDFKAKYRQQKRPA